MFTHLFLVLIVLNVVDYLLQFGILVLYFLRFVFHIVTSPGVLYTNCCCCDSDLRNLILGDGGQLHLDQIWQEARISVDHREPTFLHMFGAIAIKVSS